MPFIVKSNVSVVRVTTVAFYFEIFDALHDIASTKRCASWMSVSRGIPKSAARRRIRSSALARSNPVRLAKNDHLERTEPRLW